jgi:hypothetical protein
MDAIRTDVILIVAATRIQDILIQGIQRGCHPDKRRKSMAENQPKYMHQGIIRIGTGIKIIRVRNRNENINPSDEGV